MIVFQFSLTYIRKKRRSSSPEFHPSDQEQNAPSSTPQLSPIENNNSGTTAASSDVNPPPKNVPPPPVEPEEGEKNVIKVQFRLPDGSRRPLRALPTVSVGWLIRAAAHFSGLEEREVDLTTAFPKRSLRDDLEKLLSEADVNGEMLSVRVLGE